jgi:hypothetical protein
MDQHSRGARCNRPAARGLGAWRLTPRLAVQGFSFGLLACALASGSAVAASPVWAAFQTAAAPGAQTGPAPADRPAPPRPKKANFVGESASVDARLVADWVVVSGDNHGLPFVIVDKLKAKVFVLDEQGQLRGAAPALLGLARGDDTVPGIGAQKLATIRPEARTTPAGRFVASLGHDFEQDILWVDYETGLSLHRVITGEPGDNRFQRLASPSPQDRRISYGCVNVPVKFYETVVAPAFTGTSGIVYILPETKPLGAVFPVRDLRAATDIRGPSATLANGAAVTASR